MSKIHIVPAIIPQRIDDIAAAVETLRGNVTAVQIDIVDGLFAPFTSWPYKDEGQFSELEQCVHDKLPFLGEVSYEAHLMVSAPDEIGELLARAGATRIIGHIEAFADKEHARRVAEAWRKAGASEIGVSLLLNTPIERIETLIQENTFDMIQVMSIAKIGTQGSAFDARSTSRIRELRTAHPDLLISVDGGVDANNASELIRAGADQLAIGSAIWKSDDPVAAFHMIQKAAQESVVH